jgi:hypothetical protein
MSLRNLIPLFVMLVMTTAGLAQEISPKELTHEFIVAFPGMRKDKIQEKVMRWLENNLRSRKPVIESEDAEKGFVAGNGTVEMRASGDSVDVRVGFTINADVRDGKARFRFLNCEYFSVPDEEWQSMPEDTTWHRPAQKKFSAVVEKLTEYIRRTE